MRFLVLFTLLSFYLQAQNPIYSESFQNQNGKGATGPNASLDTSSVSWFIDVQNIQLTASSDWFRVENERFEGRDLDGVGIWLSPLIDISVNPLVRFELTAYEVGNHESSDFIQTEFRVDSGSWQNAENNGYLSDDFTQALISHDSISGNHLQLRISMANNAGTEYLSFDSIIVQQISQNTVFQTLRDTLRVAESDSTFIIDVQVLNADSTLSSQVDLVLYQGDSSRIIAPYQRSLFFTAAQPVSSQLYFLVNDTIPNANDTLIFRLQNPRGGINAGLGRSYQIAVIVEDDDINPAGKAVMINEFSQGFSGSKEWVELLTTQNGVDLRNWKLGDLDDGQYHHFLTFSQDSLFSNIPAGTLIVIYNGSDPDSNLFQDYSLNDGVLMLPSTDQRFFNGSWASFANSDPDDLPVVLNANDTIVHDLSAGALIAGPKGSEAIQYQGSSILDDSLSNPSRWQIIPAQQSSPGMGNNTHNQFWIDSLRIIGQASIINNLTIYQNGAWSVQPSFQSDSLVGLVKSGEVYWQPSNLYFKRLILESGSQWQVDSGVVLRVHENILNDGLLVIENGATLFQDSPAHENQGQGQYQIHKRFLATDQRRFSFWSSPVASAQIDSVFKRAQPNDRYFFDESQQSYHSFTSGTMQAGRGYLSTPNLQTNPLVKNFWDEMVFKGQANNGELSLKFDSVGPGDYLLLGNPYPSPLAKQQFLNDNPALQGSIWLWDASPDSISNSAYASWTRAGVNPVSRSKRGLPKDHLASGQGFMVKLRTDTCFTGDSLRVFFRNSQRSFNTQPPFFKHSHPGAYQIKLLSGNTEKVSSLIIHPKSTKSFDRNFDADLLSASNHEIAFKVDSLKLCISAIPKAKGLHALSLLVADRADYHISLVQIISQTNAENVFLYDTSAKVWHNLNQGPFTFRSTNTGWIEGRFYLSFEGPKSRIESEQRMEAVEINSIPGGLSIKLFDPSTTDIKLQIYDLQGRIIQEQSIKQAKGLILLRNLNLAKGLYLAEVSSANQTLKTEILFLKPQP